MTARSLLAWTLTLHTVWRMDILGWPFKRAALAAGFAKPEGLGNYVYRHVGVRPVQLAREGFGTTMDRLTHLLGVASSS